MFSQRQLEPQTPNDPTFIVHKFKRSSASGPCLQSLCSQSWIFAWATHFHCPFTSCCLLPLFLQSLVQLLWSLHNNARGLVLCNCGRQGSTAAGQRASKWTGPPGAGGQAGGRDRDRLWGAVDVMQTLCVSFYILYSMFYCILVTERA